VDRSRVPEIHNLSEINIPKIETVELSNGIKVHCLNSGTQEVLKIEVVFNAGRPFELKKLASRATQEMLKEGTSTLSNHEISKKVDFFGTYIGSTYNLDSNTIGFYCLSRYFKDILPILSEILFDPAFPEHELEAWKQNSKQKLKVDLERTDVRSYRTLTEQIFGKEHPYGYNSSVKLFDEIKRSDLVDHYQRLYLSGNCQIFLTGKINSEDLDLVERYIAKRIKTGEGKSLELPKTNFSPSKAFIPMKSDVQSSVRMGYKLFSKAHSDYNDLYILNNLFGGYFGSRLMMNIREEKGLTYNIYSSLDSFRNDGYFYVGSDTSSENVDQVIEEVVREMNILKSELVPEQELLMMKNYLMGSFMSMLDGPFNAGEVVKSYLSDGLSFCLFEQLIERVNHIQAEDLREVARKYLNEEDFDIVVVGNK
jgi:zinc protease